MQREAVSFKNCKIIGLQEKMQNGQGAPVVSGSQNLDLDIQPEER
jgi:hypothetical protein